MSEQNQTSSSISKQLNNSLNSLTVQNYLHELEGIEAIDIDQDTKRMDYCGSCCVSNKYSVYYPGTDKKLYEFNEKSDCCERWFLFKCRSFKMTILSISNNSINNSVILEGDKNFAGGALCIFGCGKPKITIKATSPQGFYLGKVAMNWDNCCCVTCCNTRIEIIDNFGKIKYTIIANRFPIGLECWKFTKCFDILYHIIQDDKRVGSMRKKSCSSCRICCTKSDKYTIKFPRLSTLEEKILLIIGCILIDYQSFYY